MTPRLLKPWLQIWANTLKPKGRFPVKGFALLAIGFGICALLYFFSFKVLNYIHSQNELGVILSLKILQMVWITFFALLIFSAMVNGVSTMYLSEDNEIVIASPVSLKEVYFMRYFQTTVTTTWMVVIFSLPVFAAFSTVFEAGLLFWPITITTVFGVATTASGIAISLIIAVVYLFPAKRTKDIIFYLSLCFGLFLYLIFRLIKPENLVNPDKYSTYIEYFGAISAPAGPWLPAGWAADLVSNYLLDREVDFILLGLLLTTPFVVYYIGEKLMKHLFTSGFSKSQESFGGYRTFKPVYSTSSSWRWFFRKELKLFTRDSSEWSQLFMIGALVIVYLYNFKALPIDRSPFPVDYISNLIAFANIGLAGFLAASLASRFVYPSVGAEKGAFYLIVNSPISLTQFLWYKFLFYLLPFTCLTLLLIIASNHLLQIKGHMWWISIYVALLTTWAVLALSLGFGSWFANFKAENRNASMGPGAIFFLFSAIGYQMLILMMGFIPSYRLIRSNVRGTSLSHIDIFTLISWVSGSFFVTVLIVYLAISLGARKLSPE